jgi:hypothetical protein
MARNTFTATEDMIGKYINEYLYTDVNPIGKIVGIKSKTILYVQPIEATENKTKMEFIPGGFSLHCTNNSEQKWEFKEVGEVVEMRMTVGRHDFRRISDSPRKYYDYNF